MRYLNEREVGFDPERLGFPSISGCLALVYVTENGLFGFHNAGGSANDQWAPRSVFFGNFVRNHFLGGRPGRRVYGATFAHRYGPPFRDNWRGELAAYGGSVGFHGAIRGYDLSAAGLPGSAYVEFRKVGPKCEIWIKPWNDHDRTTGPLDARMHHKWIKRDGGGHYSLEEVAAQIVTNVTTAGLLRVHSTRLRH